MPSAWLADVLGRISDHPASRLQELLPWHWARARRVAHAVRSMAAPSYVFTIARVARLLGEPEELLQEVAVDMEPEDGCLSVLDLDDVSTVAFTRQGLENLKELLADRKD
jgi:hypothetical protein